MSSKKVIVIYKGKQEEMEIEINEDNLYNSFLDIFRQKFGENDPMRHKFKLTTINTSIPYLLIDEDNIKNIIKEKIPNDAPLKLLLTKEEDFEEITRDSLEDNLLGGFVKDSIIDNDEDFKDDDFIILDENTDIEKFGQKIKNEENNEDENEKEKELNQILFNSFDNENNNSKNEIKNEENKNNTEKEKENVEENINLDENLRLSDLNSNVNINSMITEDDANDKINDNDLEDEDDEKNINNNNPLLPVIPLNIPKNIFNTEVCTLCGNTMSSFKYICSICENCNLCEKCENIHIHPCFKYKTQFLSNLTDTYKYIDKNYNYKIPIDSKKMTKLIRKEYKLKIVPMTDLQFSVRPNKIIDIPVKLLNFSDHEISSKQFIILVKNNKLINISYEVDKEFAIKPNGEYELKLLCRTSANYSKEKINIEIYSAELQIRMSSRLNFDLEIEVNDDKEDEKLNKELNNDKYAIYHSKLHKKMILSMIYYKEEWKYDLKRVCEVLRDNKWEINKSMEALSKQKK